MVVFRSEGFLSTTKTLSGESANDNNDVIFSTSCERR